MTAPLERDLEKLRALTDKELDEWRHDMRAHLRARPDDREGWALLQWSALLATARVNIRRRVAS